MNEWIDINEELPKFTNTYIVYCNIGSMFGGYKEVRAYGYEIFNGVHSYRKWCIPNDITEIVTITHWMKLPEPPEEDD